MFITFSQRVHNAFTWVLDFYCTSTCWAEVEDRHVQAAEWEQAGALSELDLTNTALSADCLLDVLLRAPALTWLAVAYCDHFNDHVMETLLDNNKFERLAALDVSYTTGLNEPALQRLLARHGARLHALLASGKPKLTEAFWLQAIPLVPNLRYAVHFRIQFSAFQFISN